MKKYLFLFVLIISCATTKPPVPTPPVPNPAPIPAPIPVPKPTPEPVVVDTIHIGSTGSVSITDFGAKVDDATDDIIADSTACSYCILNPKTCHEVTMPVGHTHISRPLILQNAGKQFTIHIKGMYPAKEASDAYLSQINCDFKSGSGIGIINGRGIVIENIALIGQYGFPNSVTNDNIGTLKFSEWVNPTISDSRYAPYAGISIDPLAGFAGTSGVEIRQCSIKQFMVGICLTPNASTLNDEMVNIIDDDIEAVRICVAIGQDQSKTINIKGLKVWASVHTVLDGKTYGRQTGGGSVTCENWNIAGNVNELFNLSTATFPLSCKDLYSESLFRIGNVGYGAGANFINTSIDFLTGPGMPATDYILNGNANFYGGCIRYYDNEGNHRLNLSNFSGEMRDMTLNNPPFVIGLYGGVLNYPTPYFDNVHLYYPGTLLKPVFDSVGMVETRPLYFSVNRTSWTAVVYAPGLHTWVSIGDYVLGDPSSTSRLYWDTGLNSNTCNTIQMGRVTSISNDSLYLDDVGLNLLPTSGFDGIYISRLK